MKNSRNFVWIGGVFLILVSTLIAYIFPVASFENWAESTEFKPSEAHDYKPLTWKLLQRLDYKKMVMPPELKSLIGQKIRIPGFVVPLSSDFREVEEFLLVPNQLACIHVPPPPPNLMLYIYPQKAMSMDELSGPIWIEGTLELKETASIYGAAAWELRADKVAPYDLSYQ